jgi:ureidoacrylate peracid hydrolase
MPDKIDVTSLQQVDFQKVWTEIYGPWSYITDYKVDAEKTALIIIDMQPAFVDDSVGYMNAYSKQLPASLAYFSERVRDLVIPNIAKLLECFRELGSRIIYVVSWSETEDLSDMHKYWRRAIRRWEEGSGNQLWRKWNEGMNVCEQIAPKERDLIVPKRTSSAFAGSMLPQILNNAEIETGVLVGCNTNGCVFSSACIGSNMGFDLIVPSDATACFAPSLQAEAENWISRQFGLVCSTQQTIDLMRGKPLESR